MRGRAAQSLAASPTMVGAITTLIIIVAVFLAYNANAGLPFVPVYRVSVDVPNAARMVENNEVRIGGNRVGVVETIEAVSADEESAQAGSSDASSGSGSGQVAARLNLKLDKKAEPIPQDSVFRIRYRSSFGLKYLEVTRGDGPAAPEGFVFSKPENFVKQTEFDDINNTFDEPTRKAGRTNLVGFGSGFAGRGTSLNDAVEGLNPLFRGLKPVARVLVEPDTRLRRLFPALAKAARIVRPVAAEQAELFTNMADAFEAISRDPEALRATIREGVPTLETGIDTLPRQQPFLREFTALSRELRPGVNDLRATLPTLNSAISVGTPVLRRTVAMNERLGEALGALEDLVEQPSTELAIERLGETFTEARPLAEHVVPAQTVCNYWNYWFTYLTEHITDLDPAGFSQRILLIGFPRGEIQVETPEGPVEVPGEVETPLAGYSGLQANAKAGAEPNPAEEGVFKPYELPIVHGNPYAPTGQPFANDPVDCQSGQSGYELGELRVPGQPAWNPALGASDLPGSRGPTTLFLNQDGSRSLVDTRVKSRQP